MSNVDEDNKNCFRVLGRLRPSFAEDGFLNIISNFINFILVYGTTNRRSSSSEPRMSNNNTSLTCKDSVASNDLCVSALAQRRSANLPKLRELCSGVSNELNISSTELPLTVCSY